MAGRSKVKCDKCGFKVDPGKETRCPCGYVNLDE